MNFTYLALLAISIAGLTAIDWKVRLVFFQNAKASAITTLVGVTYFLIWDIFGIGLGVFFKGGSGLLTGIMLAHQLPIEEPFFLFLLCYSALVIFTAVRRVIK